ncbi:MAG: STAS domain-containing protein [Campylobacterota bacterium]|nr:STAS domain-containing protein [Campylobacterota bacterium]
MSITTTQNNNRTTVNIEYERIDINNMQQVKDELLALVESNDTLVLNMQKVLFVDSSGLSVLISAFKKMISKEGSLELCALTSQPKELMEITQLNSIFNISELCN